MSQKCAHKGCEKVFTDREEDCFYHPGPPVFHEGQKGWQCCKPRVLTFEEFLAIPPCTTGKHVLPEEIPLSREEPKTATSQLEQSKPLTTAPPATLEPARNPLKPQAAPIAPASPAPPESESDDPSVPTPPNTSCRRRGCNSTSTEKGELPAGGEECVYHPGQALFHEGSKGWTCCKRRVLEFDEFLKIPGCKQKKRHLFLSSKKKPNEEETLSTVRHDFYQTPTSVIASLYIKKVDKERALIDFSSAGAINLDLPTSDKKRYKTQLPLFGQIDTAQSTYKIMGTKVELVLVKKDGASWPTLRSDEQATGEIIQTGRPGRA